MMTSVEVAAVDGRPTGAAAGPGGGAAVGAGRTGLATGGTALGLALAVGAAVALHADSVPPERGWSAVSLPLVWAAPALLALLGRWRPFLLRPAALLSAFLSVFTLSGVTLVLLVPAGLYLAAARRARVGWPGRWRTAALLAVPVGGLAAFAASLAHADPVCWEEVRQPGGTTAYRTVPDGVCAGGTVTAFADGGVVGGGSTSDTVVTVEAVLSAVLVGGTLGLGWVAAAPARRS